MIEMKRSVDALQNINDGVQEISSIKERFARERLLKQTTAVLAQAKYFSLSLDTAARIETLGSRGEALASIAEAKAAFNDISGALEIAERIRTECSRQVNLPDIACDASYARALGEIGRKQAENGDKEGASRILQRFSRSSAYEESLSMSVARGYLTGRDFRSASEIIERHTADPNWSFLREALASALAEDGNITEALQIARGTSPAGRSKDRSRTLPTTGRDRLTDDLYYNLATAQSKAHNYSAAEKAAYNIRDERRRRNALLSIQLERGDIKAAVSAIHARVSDPKQRASALAHVARKQLELNDEDGALATLTAAFNSATSIEDPHARALALARIGAEQLNLKARSEARGTFTFALDAIAHIADPTVRAEALRAILKAQVEGRDEEGSKVSFQLAIKVANVIHAPDQRAKALALAAVIVTDGGT